MVHWPSIAVRSCDGGSLLYRALLPYKARAQAAMARGLQEPEASRLTGIRLALESGIPKSI